MTLVSALELAAARFSSENNIMKKFILIFLLIAASLSAETIKIFYNGRIEVYHIVQVADNATQVYDSASNSSFWFSNAFIAAHQVK